MAGVGTVVLRHNKVHLALHQLRAVGQGAAGQHPLLLLHGLGEQTADDLPEEVAGWPGAVWGLDFTGHGSSTVPKGGGYTCELLMADADVALGHLGPATLYGRGLGGYVAVLLAGARPQVVQGAVVVDGPGLDGGGRSTPPGPPPPGVQSDGITDGGQVPSTPDPYALHELSVDVRSGEYAAGYAREAARSGLHPALVVCCRARPAWLAAVLDVDGVEDTGGSNAVEALRAFA